MSDIVVKLENAKKDFDWQDVIDLIDEVGREMDRKNKRISELEQSNAELIMLLDIERRKNKCKIKRTGRN